MSSFTPKFDAALYSILDRLEPQSRTCPNKSLSPHCEGEFPILKEDIDFYHKLHVPPPRLCFSCRNQLRCALVPNLIKFYKKDDSAKPGEKIISCFPPSSPYKIFNNHFYFDVSAWDGCSYGRSNNPSELFLKQLRGLLLDTPHYAIPRYSKNVVNSDYTIDSGDVKDCYMSATLGGCKNVNYSLWTVTSNDCFDCLGIEGSENCYENVVNHTCANCFYIQQSFECIDCTLCYDCRNCRECFGCTNLRSKQFYFFNQPLSKEEYRKRVKEIDLGKRNVAQTYLERFAELKRRSLHLHAYKNKGLNCFGHQLGVSKNCYYCFWGRGENVRWSSDFIDAKDSMDMTIGGPGELCYNIAGMRESSKITCCSFVGQSLELEYCFECFDCKNCFGCVGLKKKQYCILNVQYHEDEYWKLVDTIKAAMLKRGEYGEFIPLAESFFPYRDTFAAANYPLTDAEISAMSAVTTSKEEDEIYERALTKETIPDDIKDVDDSILEKVLLCEVSGKPFRIIQKELDFYRRFNLPIPTKHPHIRLIERVKKRDPLKLWIRTCTCAGPGSANSLYRNTAQHFHKENACPNTFETSFSPDRPEIVYCEQCYNSEIV